MVELATEVDEEISGTTAPRGSLILIGTPNRDTTSVASQFSSTNEITLTPWLPTLSTGYSDDLPVLSAEGLRRVSQDLEDGGKIAWSKMPRIYSICYALGKPDLTEVFDAEEFSDAGIPFSSDDLRKVMPDLRLRTLFYESQRMVLSNPHRPEHCWDSHQHFHTAEVPFVHIRTLGRSRSTRVDVVESFLTQHRYVRKCIIRRGQKSGVRTGLFSYVNNIEVFKELSHRHISTFMCSYSDEYKIAILTQPVADCSLESFLAQVPRPEGAQEFLQSSFGCLAGALHYLRGKGMPLKPIRPSNILIEGRSMFFTDFTGPNDSKRLQFSGRNDFSTIAYCKYCAPEEEEEVEEAGHPPYDLCDIWSLGCVFLEMWTVIQGRSMEQLSAFFLENGSRDFQYHKNIEAVEKWLKELQASSLPTELEETEGTYDGPYNWIKGMLMRDRILRTSNTEFLLRAICKAGATFTSQCCFTQNSALFSKAASSEHCT